MSLLVVLLPARDRTSPATPARETTEFAYVLSPDGLVQGAHGRAPAAMLPKADSVVAVLADADVSWQSLVLPRAPAARLRAAVAGSLEESLLDDAEHLHFALAPGAAAGQSTWVAVVNKAWLQVHLAALEDAGVMVTRVVPSSWPDEPARGHFDADADANAPLRLTFAHPQGVVQMRLQGTLARGLLTSMLPTGDAPPTQWSASPAAAAPAERWLQAPVVVQTDEQRALQATRSLWNLRQFDLAAKHRGTLALRNAWWTVMGRDWRPVRLGLVALLLLNLIGLNLWAAQLRSEVAARRQGLGALLREAHPQVRTVTDQPALQMQRENDALRTAAGRVGDGDLESALAAAAAAWPDGQAPAASLRFDGARLTVSVAGWTPPQREAFAQRLRGAGWQVIEPDGQSLALRRAP